MVGILLLYLQKAFDTVDHSLLPMKLEMFGLGHDIIWGTLFLFSYHLWRSPKLNSKGLFYF